MHRPDLIDQLAAEFQGLVDIIRDVVPYCDDMWLTQALYLFYHEQYEELHTRYGPDIDLKIMLRFNQQEFNTLQELNQVAQLRSPAHDQLVRRIMKLPKIPANEQPAYHPRFPDTENLVEFSRDHPRYIDFGDADSRVEVLLTNLVQKYYMSIQPLEIVRRMFDRIDTQTDHRDHGEFHGIELGLTSSEAIQLNHTFNRFTYDFNPFQAMIKKQIFAKHSYFHELLMR